MFIFIVHFVRNTPCGTTIDGHLTAVIDSVFFFFVGSECVE